MYGVVTDEEDSPSFLKKLLEQLHDLFVFRCRVMLPKTLYNTSVNRTKIYQNLKVFLFLF
jgi:hypothetical protein